MFDHMDCLDEVREVPKKITRKDRALSAPLLSRPKLSKPTIEEDGVDEACQSLLGRKRRQDQLPLASSPSMFDALLPSRMSKSEVVLLLALSLALISQNSETKLNY